MKSHPLLAAALLCLSPLACTQTLELPLEEDSHGTVLVGEGDELMEKLAVDEDGWGVSAPMHSAAAFDRMAFRFDAAAPTAIQARFSNDAGETWGEWRDVTVTWTEDIANNAHVDSDVRLPTSTQLRFLAPVEAGLSFLAVDLLQAPDEQEQEEALLAPEGQTEQGLAATGNVVTRTQWGAIPRNCGGAHTPNRLTVHHTVTPNNDSMSMPARMRQIQRFHIYNRGWCDVGYHFLVGQDGKVYQGRMENRSGAHASGANLHNVGVSFIGNFDVAVPPANMLDAGARIIRALSQFWGISLNRTRVKGHRQVGNTATSCPGQHLYARLEQLLSLAASGASAAPPPPPPPPVGFDVHAGDFNGNGRDDIVTLSKNAEGGWANWAALELSTGGSFTSQTWSAVTTTHMRNGGKDRSYRTVVADFNGDGKADLATISKDGGGGWSSWVAMELSTGSGFTSQTWSAQTPSHMRNGNSGRSYNTVVGDFNGDGKADLATISKDGGGGWSSWVALELSTGSGFTSQTWNAQTPTHMRNGNSGRDYRVLVGDYNGDGRDDLATITRDGAGGWSNWVAMELSTGSGFTSRTWSAQTPTHMRNGNSGRDYRVLVGDFNGDGKADLGTISKDGGGGWSSWLAMELSTGSGFTSQTWSAQTPTHMRNGLSSSAYSVFAADFNGDGRDDIATLSPNGGGGWKDWLAMELSSGNGFSSRTWTAQTPMHIRNGATDRSYATRLGDFDGDGTADLATVSPNGGGAWKDWIAVERAAGSTFTSQAWSAATPQHMRNGTP